MTTETKTESKRTHEGAEVTSAAAAKPSPDQPLIPTPVVFELRARTDGKRKYSKGTKDSQRFALGVSKAAYRTANAFADGLSTFSDRSSKSADKRRDGIVRDSLRNASKGFEDGLNELGKAPDEIASRISGRFLVKTFRAFSW